MREVCVLGSEWRKVRLQSGLGTCTVQYSTVQYSTVQYSTVQYSTVQYSTVQYSTVQCSTVQCSAVLQSGLDTIDNFNKQTKIKVAKIPIKKIIFDNLDFIAKYTCYCKNGQTG